MRHRYSLISAFIAALVLVFIQIPSNAHMLDSLSMATGMSKAQVTSMENALGQAYNYAIAKAHTTITPSKLRRASLFRRIHVGLAHRVGT
jgi:hypothetical protein